VLPHARPREHRGRERDRHKHTHARKQPHAPGVPGLASHIREDIERLSGCVLGMERGVLTELEQVSC